MLHRRYDPFYPGLALVAAAGATAAARSSRLPPRPRNSSYSCARRRSAARGHRRRGAPRAGPSPAGPHRRAARSGHPESQVRYDPDWKPLELTIDGTARGQAFGLHTTVTGTTATTTMNNAGQPIDRTRYHHPRCDAAAEPVLAAYEALTPRLMTAASGVDDSRVPGRRRHPSRCGSESRRRPHSDRLAIDHRRRTIVTLIDGATGVAVDIWGDQSGRLLRITCRPRTSSRARRHRVGLQPARRHLPAR